MKLYLNSRHRYCDKFDIVRANDGVIITRVALLLCDFYFFYSSLNSYIISDSIITSMRD